MKRQTSITYQQNQTYFLTTTITEFTHLFQLPELAQIIIDNINFYIKKFNILIHGYVIMPNHVHLLLSMGEIGTVSEFMGQWKEFSAKQIIDWCQKNKKQELLNIFSKSAEKHKPTHSYQVWQSRFDDLVVFNENLFRTKLNYIHNNPLQKHWELTRCNFEYPYFSAIFYYKDLQGDILITPISLL